MLHVDRMPHHLMGNFDMLHQKLSRALEKEAHKKSTVPVTMTSLSLYRACLLYSEWRQAANASPDSTSRSVAPVLVQTDLARRAIQACIARLQSSPLPPMEQISSALVLGRMALQTLAVEAAMSGESQVWLEWMASWTVIRSGASDGEQNESKEVVIRGIDLSSL